LSLSRRIRKVTHSSISYRAAVLCLAALSVSWARYVPPSVSYSSPNSAFHTIWDHDRHLCFDHEDPQWPTAPSTALSTLSPIVSSQPIRNAEPPVEFMTDGHYDRPPPAR